MASMSQGRSYPFGAFVLTLVAGILTILGGLYLILIAAIFGATFGPLLAFAAAIIYAAAAITLIFGLILLVGALRMRSNPQSARSWGIIVFVLSLIALIFGGAGFYIGPILGLIGGILAIIWKAPAAAQPAWGQPNAPSMGGPSGAASPLGSPSGGKTCASCGSPNAPGVQFCAKCGAPMA